MGVRIYLRKRPVGRLGTPGLLPANDVVLYTPARLSQTGRRKWQRLPWHPDFEYAAAQQNNDTQEARAQTAWRRSLVRVGTRGRPRVHQDQAVLDYLGLRRYGGRLHEHRTMSAETRARRRYSLQAPEWRELLTEDEFVKIEMNMARQKRRHSALRLPWNAAACRTELINDVLKTKEQANEISGTPDRDRH